MEHVGDVDGQRDADVVVAVETARAVGRCHGAPGGGALQGVVVDGAQQILPPVEGREPQRLAEPAGRGAGGAVTDPVMEIVHSFIQWTHQDTNSLQY